MKKLSHRLWTLGFASLIITSCNLNEGGSSGDEEQETDPTAPENPVNDVVFTDTAEDKAQRKALKDLWIKIMADYNPTYPFTERAEQDTGAIFATKPSFKSPYQVAVHSDRFKNHALNWYNFYRTVGRLTNVTIDTTAQKQAEACATGLTAIRAFKHGLNAAEKAKITARFSQQVADGASSGSATSNLWRHASGSNFKFHGTVEMNFTEGKMLDAGGKVSISPSSMGHRWWGLKAGTKTFGVGFVATNQSGDAENGKWTLACYKVTGGGVSSATLPARDYSAFPNGYFPIQADMEKVASVGNKNFLKRTRQPISLHSWKRNYYTVWTLQNFKGYTITRGKEVKVTIRKNAKNGKVLDSITTTWAGTPTSRDDGAFLRAHNKGASGAGNHMIIKPKHGIISGAFKAVQGNGEKRAFHITIEGEAISPKIEYHIVYYDLEHYQE